MKTTKLEIKVSGKGRFIAAEVKKDGTVELTAVLEEEINHHINDESFILVEASKLSLDNSFMKYEPTTKNEKNLKDLITQAINKKMGDFYRPKYDPSFADKSHTKIQYVAGKKAAVGKSYNWWSKTLKEFCSERKSHQGTLMEYAAFLGVLIKDLVTQGWTVSKAWDAVCNDSKELGHYWNSENAKYTFEQTASREVCSFCDLANTYKILAEDEETGGFWLAGGSYFNGSNNYPLADFVHFSNCSYDNNCNVGWLVLSKQY